MLPAVPPIEGGWPVRWPTDGRAGGVPDPRAVGPTMIQIGNDGGLLPQAVTLKNTPVGLSTQTPSAAGCRRWASSPPIIAVTGKTLYLAPGERADVIVDFSQVPAGSKLILYNDAPAPAPNGDSRVDYYTGDADQTAIGGAPATVGRVRAQHAHDPAVPGRGHRPRRRSTSSGCDAPAGRLRGLPGPRAGPDGRVRRGVRDHGRRPRAGAAPGRRSQRRGRRRQAVHLPRERHAHLHPLGAATG